MFKQDKEKFVVPKSVQAVIPIKTIWEDGIFLVDRNKYAKTFKFEDINYAVASREDKEAMFLEYSEILNSLHGKQVPFKASAAIPRIYRIKFHRDIYKDRDALGKAVGNGDAENSRLDMFSLEMFENIAYVMAKHADSSIPDFPEEWLDEFSTFSIYQVLPKIIELWGLNVQTDVSSKKTSPN